jgi:hypothetical protein
MTKRFFKDMVFLAPRRTAYDNLQSTIKNGIPYSRVATFLDADGQKILGNYSKVYAWGNVVSKKGSWSLMNPGDLILFYAHKEFIFAGRCLYKQLSERLSDALWPRSPRNKFKPWSCVFFVHDIRPIKIPLDIINELSGYKLAALQGFQSLNEKGIQEIKYQYGSLDNFVSVFQKGTSSEQVALINHITKTDKIDGKKLEDIDAITRGRDIDEVISEWKDRNLDKKPEEVETRVARLKRCYTLIKALKDKYNNQCQICGFTFKTSNGQYYSEAAHIIPLSSRISGIDTPENILILCPNHHKMLDYGAIMRISDEEIEINGVREKIKR